MNPLLDPQLAPDDPRRAHEVAAEHLVSVFDEGAERSPELVRSAWEHALQAERADLAGPMGLALMHGHDARGLYRDSLRLAEWHLEVFPDDPRGLRWVGSASLQTGDPHRGRELLARPVETAERGGVPKLEVASVRDVYARALYATGALDAAADEESRVLDALVEARGTEEHPDVAASLHALGQVLHGQGDLSGARERLERSLAIEEKVYGAREHYTTAETEFSLAMLLAEQDRQDEARVGAMLRPPGSGPWAPARRRTRRMWGRPSRLAERAVGPAAP